MLYDTPERRRTFKHIWFPNCANPTHKNQKILNFPNARQNDDEICTIQNDNIYLTNDVK